MDSRAAQKAVNLRLQARPPAAQNEAHMAPAMGGGGGAARTSRRRRQREAARGGGGGAATPAGDDAATGEGRADGGSNGPPRIYAEEDEAGRDGGRNDRRKTKPAVTATGGRSGDGSATGGSEPTKAAGAPDPRLADAMAGGSGADGRRWAARMKTGEDGRRNGRRMDGDGAEAGPAALQRAEQGTVTGGAPGGGRGRSHDGGKDGPRRAAAGRGRDGRPRLAARRRTGGSRRTAMCCYC